MNVATNNERGAVAITVALAMVLLMGMAAVTLDGGLALNERRGTQNSADHAALAAAWAACTGGGDPIAAGTQVASDNGYAASADIDVQIIPEGGNAYRAIISTTNETEFAPVIGTNNVTVLSEAVADCTRAGALGGFALFAGADTSCPGQELSTPGSSLVVNGGAHSNGDFQSTGPPGGKHYNGPVSHVGNVTGSSTQFHGGISQTGSLEYPVPTYWTIDSYAPGGSRALAAGSSYFPFVGTLTRANITGPGLYFVEGDAHLVGVDRDDVTIVATEDIRFAAGSTGNRMTPFEDDGLLLFSNHDAPDPCGQQVAIHWAAASNTFSGVVFAPDGQCRKNNAGALGLDGSIICATINLAGAGVNITYNENFGGDTGFTVELKD